MSEHRRWRSSRSPADCSSRPIARRAFTTTLDPILFFGSLNFFGIGILGEYLAKIFEEVKRRPLSSGGAMIRDGEVRPAADEPFTTAP